MTLYFSLLHIQLFNSVIVGQIGTVSYSFLLCVNCAYIFKLISIGFYFTLLLCFHCTPNNALLFYLFLILLDVHNSGYLVSQVNYWPINPELLGIQPSPAQASSAQPSPAQPSPAQFTLNLSSQNNTVKHFNIYTDSMINKLVDCLFWTREDCTRLD